MIDKFNLSAKIVYNSEIILSLGIIDKLNLAGIFKTIRQQSKHILITDENVNELYANKVIDQLKNNGFNVFKIVIPPNEESKSIEQYNNLISKSLEYGFDKKSVIFSLGGGVVNNLAGFLASTLYRGIGLVHIPTSMLAQVDAAIDFKQAINYKYGKNLVGSYYPATHIIIDPSVIKTLDQRFVYDGLAESIKHALCQSNDFYIFLYSNFDRLNDEEILYKIIQYSIKLKLELMNDDLENDFDESIKQYGHAVGHAIEHLSDGEIYHGEAISIGMCISAEIALLLDISNEETLYKHYNIFKLYNLPTQIPEKYNFKEIWNKMKFDKHTLDGKIYTGLIKKIGTMNQIEEDEFGYYIDENILKTAIHCNKKREL